MAAAFSIPAQGHARGQRLETVANSVLAFGFPRTLWPGSLSAPQPTQHPLWEGGWCAWPSGELFIGLGTAVIFFFFFKENNSTWRCLAQGGYSRNIKLIEQT